MSNADDVLDPEDVQRKLDAERADRLMDAAALKAKMGADERGLSLRNLAKIGLAQIMTVKGYQEAAEVIQRADAVWIDQVGEDYLIGILSNDLTIKK